MKHAVADHCNYNNNRALKRICEENPLFMFVDPNAEYSNPCYRQVAMKMCSYKLMHYCACELPTPVFSGGGGGGGGGG